MSYLYILLNNHNKIENVDKKNINNQLGTEIQSQYNECL